MLCYPLPGFVTVIYTTHALERLENYAFGKPMTRIQIAEALDRNPDTNPFNESV